MIRSVGALPALLMLFLVHPALGQAGESPPEPALNATDLAKETQNPVGDIISVPFQFNFNSGGAFQDQTFFNLNLQPVIPIQITPGVTLISRTIVPIDSVPVGSGVSYSGTGDIQQQIFFTPAHAGKIIWGLHAGISTHRRERRAQDQSVYLAVFYQLQLRQRLGSRDCTGHHRQLGRTRGQKWTVPVAGGISRTLVFNHQPMSLGFQYYYNAKRPDSAASTTLRFSIALIYPTKQTK